MTLLPGIIDIAGTVAERSGFDTTGKLIGKSGSRGYSLQIIPLLLIIAFLFSAMTVCVSGSTPPPAPRVSVSVTNRTIGPGSGIDVSAEWTENGVVYPLPLETMTISLYGIPDGSLLAAYTIPKTGEKDSGAVRVFSGTIPGAILPAGDVMLVASDPVSGEGSRVPVRILAAGELYREYRSRQVLEEIFYPASTSLILVLLVILGTLVVKRPQTDTSTQKIRTRYPD
jgi:hypothetical protein